MNSKNIRSRNNYEFRKKLIEIHEKDIRDFDRKADSDEYELKNGLKIAVKDSVGTVARNAVYDFADYLRTSMNVSSIITFDMQSADICVELAADAGYDLGEFASYKGFAIETGENGIRIYGHDERGIAQALYYLEDIMSFESAPVVKFGKITKKPMFSPQMIHSVYGLDEYPEEYLARVAHEGRDAILVFTRGLNKTPMGYSNFNELIERAAKYGIDVYAYSYMSSNMSPYEPEAEEFYEGTYGELFRVCPGLKGVTLVGESVEFPSRDPHVAKGRYFEVAKDGIPADKPSSGWYPCYDYPVWLELLKKTIRKYNPDADIVFWTYNWNSQPEEARLKLIESLPTDISVQVTFELGHWKPYIKSMGRAADYTLSVAGPCEVFAAEAAAAAKKGIRLYSMTNTGGRTWDFGPAPYEPMPYQWMERYAAMRKAYDDWGLCGIMESHHFGFFPSFISKLSKHSFMEPREDMNELLKKILSSEFGRHNYTKVDAALKHMSDGIRYYTPSDSDQYGAYRVGPAYPFNLLGGSHLGNMAEIPYQEEAMFKGICEVTYINRADSRISPLGMRIKDEIIYQEKMLSHFNEAVKLLNETENRNESLEALITLCTFLRNCVITGKHAKEWYVLKCRMCIEEFREGYEKIFDEMEQLLREEIKNAEDTIPLVEKDSLLGFEPSMLYVTDRWHLEWKIRQVNYILNRELKQFRTALEA